jgi:hypothetical protein
MNYKGTDIGFSEGVILCSCAVGSRVTCVPTPIDTDDDHLCLVSDIKEFVDQALELGFYIDGSLMGGSAGMFDSEICKSGLFVSMKSHSCDLNLIASSDFAFVHRFRVATSVCKRLNLLNKQDRIALFQAVLYGQGKIDESYS